MWSYKSSKACICTLSTCCLAHCSPLSGHLQVIHVLEVATSAMCCIMPKNFDVAVRGLAWSHDSQAIIVPCHHDSSYTRHYRIHSRSGQQVLEFSEAGASKMLPHMASTIHHRLVTTHTYGLRVWDLSSGQVLEDKILQTSMSTRSEGRVASNRSGSQVAWCAPITYALHVFYAASLSCLSIIDPAQNLSPMAIKSIWQLQATVTG